MVGWDADCDHMVCDPETRRAHPTTTALNVLTESINTAMYASHTDLDAAIGYMEDQQAELDSIVNLLPGDTDRSRLHLAIVNLAGLLESGAVTLQKLQALVGPQREQLKASAFEWPDHV